MNIKKTFTGLLKKENDKLFYMSQTDQTTYDLFSKNLPNGSLVEVYMEIQKDDGTLAQLAKVHSMIRELAMFIGESFEDMKLIVKKRTGLCIEKELEGERFLYCKSLGKCSKEELSMCIETMKQIGLQIDYFLE
jgi:hypothetical protein